MARATDNRYGGIAMAERTSVTRPPESNGPVVDLQAAVSSLAAAILAARVALDVETARVAKLYQGDEILRLFPPPAFSIGEVTVRMTPPLP